MTDIVIATLDWVPQGPRGLVRDLRLRWACREAGFDYAVETVPFDDRETNHLDAQPFGQVPYLRHGAITMFESGACLLHLADMSESLMPRDAEGRAQTTQWVFAALNSIELAVVPWWVLGFSGSLDNPLKDWAEKRLCQLEAVLASRDWIAAGRFTVADLLLADVLRVPQVRALPGRPASEAYLDRILSRPAFVAAHAEQLAQFEAADERRAESGGAG